MTMQQRRDFIVQIRTMVTQAQGMLEEALAVWDENLGNAYDDDQCRHEIRQASQVNLSNAISAMDDELRSHE